MSRSTVAVILAVTLGTSCSRASAPVASADGGAPSAAADRATPIEGVWQLVKTTRSDGSEAPHQAGRLIFTRKHYMATYDIAPVPRVPLPEGGAAKATADELRATYGGFNAASGVYEVTGGSSGEVTVRDDVAMVPQRTEDGAFLVLAYEVEGDTYTTRPLRNHNGPLPPGLTFTFTRVE
ncbi:MAG: lipocalin-like domain-containing protein [Acidimicrobiia bacterium]|nr:lipocalin-like domain-containing protein [Acidimicrobiia bacterium]